MKVEELNILSKQVADLKIRKTDLENSLKEINNQLDKVEVKFVEALIQDGIDKWSNDYGTFTPRISTHWKILDNQQLVKYLENNAPEMVKIHPQTIRGWANTNRDIDINWDYGKLGIEPYDIKKITYRRK